MKKSLKVLQFKVLIEQDEDGLYLASVPELAGCYTQGKTLEEVRKRIKEVIELVLETDKDAKREKLAYPAAAPRFFGIEDISVSYA
ncbi:type II toxin-antitoxin system HicB family antitoxin [Candidatus Gottesmanbacteria bacterium]|nr:type II toxin-antitoxin system HicB family antitoxin [Candidatus Gottesmanbacteria bacterium]